MFVYCYVGMVWDVTSFQKYYLSTFVIKINHMAFASHFKVHNAGRTYNSKSIRVFFFKWFQLILLQVREGQEQPFIKNNNIETYTNTYLQTKKHNNSTF